MAQSSPELAPNLLQGEPSGALSRHDNHILRVRALMPVAAEELSHKPLHPVADHGLTHPGANRYAEPRLPEVIRLGDHEKVGSVDFAPSPVQAQKLRAPRKTRAFGEALPYASVSEQTSTDTRREAVSAAR